ncbi:hypothetical protein J2S53_004427 [Actinopolyspora lacussalsi]|nr:hypothetical protein [Actinopolyspora lacussalsi]
MCRRTEPFVGLRATTGDDELMITVNVADRKAESRSYELVA